MWSLCLNLTFGMVSISATVCSNISSGNPKVKTLPTANITAGLSWMSLFLFKTKCKLLIYIWWIHFWETETYSKSALKILQKIENKDNWMQLMHFKFNIVKCKPSYKSLTIGKNLLLLPSLVLKKFKKPNFRVN